MRQRKFGIQSDRLLSIFLCNRLELLPQEHSRSEQVTGSGVGRHVEHPGKRLTRLGIVFGLDVTDAQYVRGINVCAREPGVHSLKVGNGIRGMAAKIVRETKELHGFAVLGIFLYGRFQVLRGLLVVTLLVVSST